MKKTENQKRKETYLKRWKIPDLFQNPEQVGFELYEFSKGEIINNLMDPSDYLLFTVAGAVRVYNIRDNGTMALLTEGESFTVLGDVEFTSKQPSAYIVEALSKVSCIAVNLRHSRQVLESDPVFLTFLLSSVTEKLNRATSYMLEPDDLRDRILYYMSHADARTMKGVASAASYLHCSKRQLLRILKQLQEEGRIKKTGKGIYRLV
jgi:CRP-like cAMP-binding protein